MNASLATPPRATGRRLAAVATTSATTPRIRRVVIGVDLRAPSIAAAAWCARDLAPGATFTLVHSCSDVGSCTPHVRTRAERRLRALREDLAGASVRTEIVEGDPADRIAEIAVREAADLVVVGAHAAAPGPWGRFGTTAERLLRHSPVPVLLAAGPLDRAPRRLLVPVATDVSEPVLAWARALETRFDAGVAVVHLASAGDSAGGRVSAAQSGDERRWPRLTCGLRSDQVFVDAVVEEPGACVVAQSARFGADLVVVDTTTLRDLHRARAGLGVVLRRTPCAVLVVRSTCDA